MFLPKIHIRQLRCLPKQLFLRQFCKCASQVPPEVLEELEQGFEDMKECDSKSLLKKHLTKERFDKLKDKTTPTYNSTLLDCIRSGLKNPDSGVGIYAPDPEAYSTFSDIFDPIIEDYHGGFKKTSVHPPTCFGFGSDFPNLDPDNLYIVSTRVRCGRSIKDFPFNPCLSKCDYNVLDSIITDALLNLSGEYSGTYFPLCGMEKDKQQELIDSHLLFKEGDRFLKDAKATRYWPTGRGIYINDNRNFLVWVNEEDHVRIISMEKGGNLGAVYERLILGENQLSKQLEFSRDKRLGYLTFCPTNLGTSLRASVHMRLPSLADDKAKLDKMAAKYNLQVRGTRGEHTDAEDGVYDISNKRRMGLTEYEAIQEMYKGIRALIDHECQEAAKACKK
ncbi:arginine kinase [Drosophila busckii]|uniref:arginine kinase n=1 Tax=Drosophila busckii TaxID=30019 RepID=UPI00083EDA99|nr:arginine kinase [Drosophila busckii]